MTDFRYYHSIEVRYGDLDPQGHLNNAKYLTFLEQARVNYVIHLGLFNKGDSFADVGFILADAHITFKKAVEYLDPVKVGVRISKIGNKSMASEYEMIHAETREVYATGAIAIVTYDYRTQKTILVPDKWRKAISEFEGIQ